MPTPVQRVQVLLRPRVLEAIKELSAEEDLTLSKTCSMLVEEALISRGLFNKTTRRKEREEAQPAGQMAKDVVEAGLSHFLQQAVAGSDTHMTTVEKKTEAIDDEDLELLKKLKALKSVGLL